MKLLKSLQTIIARIKGKTCIIPIDHPNAEKIVKLAEKINSYPESVREQIQNAVENRAECLADIKMYLKKHTSNLFEVDAENNVYIDQEKLPHCIGKKLLEFSDLNVIERAQALINFWAKCKENPDPRAQSDLFQFLEHNGFPITSNGNFVAYKGVYYDSGEYRDSHTRSISQKPGLTVEMPREDCDPDPHSTCSRGFHAATLSYAKGYGDRIISVEINPKDVVAIPTDANQQKLRTCKFISLEDLTKKFNDDKAQVQEFEESFIDDDEDDDIEDDDYCYDCGESDCYGECQIDEDDCELDYSDDNGSTQLIKQADGTYRGSIEIDIDGKNVVENLQKEIDKIIKEEMDKKFAGIIPNKPIIVNNPDYLDPCESFTVTT